MAGREPKLHIYRRVKHPKRRDLWYCLEVNCNHRINQMYLLGKQAKCAYCLQPFIITAKKLHDQSILHCDNCKKRGPKPEVTLPTVSELEQLLKDVI